MLSFELTCEQITAKWSDITKFHQLELNNLVKMSKLPEGAVRPKPMYRQNVSAVLQAFLMKRLMHYIDLRIIFMHIILKAVEFTYITFSFYCS